LLVNRCKQVIAVVDATKWGRVGLASFARLADVDVVITDHNARPDLVEQARSAGVEVVLV
jgi:DeoR/GlpR family transcriptional regulator of sugar metabolism